VDFSGNIASFATGTYTVTRRGPSTVGVDGRADLATSTTFSILAAVQPLGGRDLQLQTNGMRVAERQTLYTETRLRVKDDPDIVTIAGEDWEVENQSDQSVMGNYFKATIVRVGN